MEHYRCFKICIPSSGGVRISDTIIWFPHCSLKLPTLYNHGLICSAIDDLRATIQLFVKTISYYLKATYTGKIYLNLMPSSIIDTYVILIPNFQGLPTFQGWKFNQRIPLYLQGCNFIQMIPRDFQECNHQPLHLHNNQHFDNPNTFSTSPSL